jgi:DNA polymerase-3 subunit alpha
MSSAGPEFVHLHLHTEFSLVDSVVRIPELMESAVQSGLPALAMTDQMNLFGWVKFYKAALAAGIKPLVGADMVVAAPGMPGKAGRLVLLARNDAGYLNLKRLISRAWLADDQAGVLDADWLTPQTTDGLIALSGGCQGELAHLLGQVGHAAAENYLRQQSDLFGGDFFIEVMRTGRPGEDDYLESAVELASRSDVPIVATNDVRFLGREDYETHEARTCIHGGFTLADKNRPRLYSEQQFLRSAEEMAKLFADLPEALENSVAIAKRCNVDLELGQSYLPDYEIPTGQSPDAYLKSISTAGLKTKFEQCAIDKSAQKDYGARLKRELGVISEMGFPGYFLIVADFIRWAKENGVPVGPGRGSGAGSLVAWAIGITDLDPLEFDLLFERFLNPERVSMPDFDIDFCMAGRDRVIDYVAERYGRDRVAQIITYGTMGAKAVVRDVGRVMGHPYGFADRIARLIPPTPGMTLAQAFDEEPELGQIYNRDEEVRELIDLARELEGLSRNAGTHAGGVVIAPSELNDFAPLYRAEGEQTVVTQFDMKDVESVGLVKFDFLGLRTLTIIDKALATVNAKRAAAGEAAVDLATIPMDDERTFQLLQSSQTHAVFQLESRGMRDLIKRLKPDCFDDIVALVALFRPGPLQSGMVDIFIERKHSGSDDLIDYLHPDLEPVLANTYGVFLYQEQVMQAAQTLAGYTLGQADLLRRAMGKKIADEMAKQRDIFVDGAVANGVDKELATHIFGLMEKFAEYGFNKSHSAAYALLAYQTAWLKANYPSEFMAAALSADSEYTDKLELHHRECRALGIRLKSPDINKSGEYFSVDGETEIAYGLAAIKGMGVQAAQAIIAERQSGGPFRDLYDFCRRTDQLKVNKRAVEALIKSGALDSMGSNRPSLLGNLGAAMGAAEQQARAAEAGQNDMFGDAAPPPPPRATEVLPRWSPRKLYQAELESLGLYLSGHPFDQYRADCAHICTGSIASVIRSMPRPERGAEHWRNAKEVTLAGLITDIRKRGNRVTMYLDDGEERVELTLFAEAFQEFRHLLDNHSIRVVTGKLRFDDFIDGWRLAVKNVRDIDRVIEKRASRLVIHWLARQSKDLSPDKLQALLAPYRPGRCDVALYYTSDDAAARVVLGEDWSVRPSGDLRDKLAETVGVDAFRFSYEKKSAA